MLIVIIQHDDKIEIIFNSPIKISPDNNHGFFIAE